MSIYRYSAPSVIDEITTEKTEGNSVRAYLHAREGVSQQELALVSKAVTSQGWQAIPNTHKGQSVLEIRGFVNERKLIAVANEQGWVQGSPTIEKMPEPKLNFKDQVKKRSLQASGAFYLIGDAAFMTYGYKGGSWWNGLGGAAYGAGTLSLLGFGNKDKADLQVRDIAKPLADYMKKHGSTLPQNCSLDEIGKEHKKGLIKSSNDLFRRYPSEMMNVFFAAAGLCIGVAAHKSLKEAKALESLMKSSGEIPSAFAKEVEEVFTERLLKKPLPAGANIEKEKFEFAKKMLGHHKQEAWLDIGLGSMTGVSGLFAMAVKEKAHDPDAPKKTGVAAIWEKIQEKPLAIAGAGYMVSTLCHAVSTTIAWKYAGVEKKKSVPFRAIFVIANLVAEVLLAISSKGHGSGVKSDGTIDDTVIALAAEAIATQPIKMQNTVIEHVAKFLGSNEALAIKDKDVVDKLRAAVERVKNNPWAQCKAEPVSAQTVMKKSIAPEVAEGAWQAAVAAQPIAGQPVVR